MIYKGFNINNKYGIGWYACLLTRLSDGHICSSGTHYLWDDGEIHVGCVDSQNQLRGYFTEPPYKQIDNYQRQK